MARAWEMSPADAQAGDPGPLRIFDLGHGPEGRAVCILPGSTARQAQDSTLQRMLDDQDLANATAIMLVPRMRRCLRSSCSGPRTWAAGMPRAGAPQRTSLHACTQALTHPDSWRGRARRLRPFILISIVLETDDGIRR
jgi:hypothetical protein